VTTTAKIIIGVLTVLLLTASAPALYHWYRKPQVITHTEFVPAKPIPKAAKVKRVKVPGPKEVVTLDKPTLLQKIDLPQSFKDNPDLQAIATASIAPYRGTTSAIALLNTQTGVGEIIAKREPLPLFGFVNDKEVGIRAGVNTKGNPEVTAYGKWDFVRVGNAHIGAYVEASSTGDAKAQIGIGYRFD
jgi:hypothetical protein